MEFIGIVIVVGIATFFLMMIITLFSKTIPENVCPCCLRKTKNIKPEKEEKRSLIFNIIYFLIILMGIVGLIIFILNALAPTL